jgi:Lipid A core - O-antigen ligase and related enzymes
MILSCIIHKDKLSKIVWKQDKLVLSIFLISIFGLLIMSPGNLAHETYLFICSIAIYFFSSRILQTPTQILWLFFSLATCVAYLGNLAIVDIALLPDTTMYIDHATGRWQGVGYYANSNEFGQLMITTIPFLLAAILIRKSIFLSIASMALISIMIFVMIKTESRTVMVTLALMFVGTFMLRGGGNIAKKAIIGGVMTVVMLVALTFMPGPTQERMSTVLDAGNDESFQGRTRSWDHGFAMLSWYPITGVGKGQWIEYHGLMPHNSYVQVMAELGVFGIWIFLWILLLSLKQFSPVLSHPTDSPRGPPVTNNENDEIYTYIDSSDVFMNISDEKISDSKQTESSSQYFNNTEKTVAIATLVTFCGWLLYVFLGNQGYSVWMYFYIGLCAALANFMPLQSQKPALQADYLLDNDL